MSKRTMEDRRLAEEFAEELLKTVDYDQADHPCLRRVLTEAVLFESPSPTVSIGMLKTGTLYKLSIRGYQYFVDTKVWNQTFLGLERQIEMLPVVNSFVTFAEKAMVLEVKAAQFHHAGPPTRMPPLRGGRRRRVVEEYEDSFE